MQPNNNHHGVTTITNQYSRLVFGEFIPEQLNINKHISLFGVGQPDNHQVADSPLTGQLMQNTFLIFNTALGMQLIYLLIEYNKSQLEMLGF